jgi:hypothetical protein
MSTSANITQITSQSSTPKNLEVQMKQLADLQTKMTNEAKLSQARTDLTFKVLDLARDMNTSTIQKLSQGHSFFE